MRQGLTKSIIGISLVLLLCLQAKAQEVDYTQYYLNLAGTNPGFTGVENYLDLKTGFRQGWNDFNTKNNNFYVSAYGVLNKAKRTLTTNNSLRISNPSLYKEIQSNKKLRRKHGLGGMITNRTFGPYKAIQVNVNYSYHLPLTEKLNLSLGSRAGYSNQRINFSNFTVRDEINDLFYQQLISSNQGIQNSLLVDFGSVLYSNQFYFGISTSNLISKPFRDQLLEQEKDLRINMQTAVNFSLGNNFSLSPALKVIYSKQYDLLWSANARLRYQELIYVGSGFNSENKLSILFGLSLNNRISINYAYDQYLAELKDFNATTHELVVGVFLLRKYGVKTKFW